MEMHLAKVLKVYQKRLRYWKESDQREDQNTLQSKRLRRKSRMRKLQQRHQRPFQRTRGYGFTLLPVKSSFTMSNILIDNTVVQDLILGDKGSNIGEAHAGLYKTVRKLFKEDLMTIVKTFFDFE
jgi:hypothetical protein